MSVAEQAQSIMKVKEACEYLQISERKMRDLVAEGEIPFARIGKSIRFSKVEIDKWFKKKMAAG
jgi:excisionase family DNA binding protein